MAALIPDERCAILASFIFFLQIKTQQAGTSASTYKLMEPHWDCRFPFLFDLDLINLYVMSIQDTQE